MLSPRVRNALMIAAASVGLTGCVGFDPYGGFGGVSVGYGNGYGYGDQYGYGDPYGYGYGSGYGSPYGSYGYGAPYYGWYDDYYYPGTGYYVYNRTGSRYRWNDTQRRYWESHRDRRGRDNWSSYRNGGSDGSYGRETRPGNGVVRVDRRQAMENAARVENGVRMENGARIQNYEQYRQRTSQENRGITVERQQERSEARQQRNEARKQRSEAQQSSRADRGVTRVSRTRDSDSDAD